jgi:hypothetical protein
MIQKKNKKIKILETDNDETEGHSAGQEHSCSFLGTPTGHKVAQEAVFRPGSALRAANAGLQFAETSPTERGEYEEVQARRLPPGVYRGVF